MSTPLCASNGKCSDDPCSGDALGVKYCTDDDLWAWMKTHRIVYESAQEEMLKLQPFMMEKGQAATPDQTEVWERLALFLDPGSSRAPNYAGITDGYTLLGYINSQPDVAWNNEDIIADLVAISENGKALVERSQKIRGLSKPYVPGSLVSQHQASKIDWQTFAVGAGAVLLGAYVIKKIID